MLYQRHMFLVFTHGKLQHLPFAWYSLNCRYVAERTPNWFNTLKECLESTPSAAVGEVSLSLPILPFPWSLKAVILGVTIACLRDNPSSTCMWKFLLRLDWTKAHGEKRLISRIRFCYPISLFFYASVTFSCHGFWCFCYVTQGPFWSGFSSLVFLFCFLF